MRDADDEWHDADRPSPARDGDGPDRQTTAADDEFGGNVAGDLVGSEEVLEPGSPSVESAVFVLLGAAVTTLLFLAFAGVI